MTPQQEAIVEILNSKDWLIKEDGSVFRKGKCVGYKKSQGYIFVRYGLKNFNRRIEIPIHRLVCARYLGTESLFKEGMAVNHKNAIKTDNRIENLEIITQKENNAHARAMGLMPKMLPHFGNKYNEKHAELVPQIMDLYHQGWGSKAIGDKFNINKSTIWYILDRNKTEQNKMAS